MTEDNEKNSLLDLQKQLLSPLNIILGFTQLFEMDDNLSISQKNRLNEINRSVEQIFKVIDDLPILIDDKSTSNENKLQSNLILIVEDNLTNQELLLQQLEMLGYSADKADNGQEALEKLTQINYQIILTDLNMPLVDGYQLTQEIRNKERSTSQHCIIIAITANALIGEKEKCLQSGMDGYLSKPLNIHDLKKLLDKWSVNLLNLQSTITNQEIQNKQNQESNQGLDESHLIRSLGNDQSKHINVLSSFLKYVPGIINDLSIAYDARDMQQIRFYSHKLKSSSRAIGAIELADVNQKIEQAADNQNWDIIDSLLPTIEPLYTQIEIIIKRDYFTQKTHTKDPETDLIPAGKINANFDLNYYNNILIIDDDEVILTQLSIFLENLKYKHIITVNNATQGLELV
ncbi:MAG: response regulator, partial [Pseudomonadota bacterium]